MSETIPRWGFRRSDITDYMQRWIFHTPFGTLRVHKILRSDDDRHLHDHPWSFASLILRGRYFDVFPGGSRSYRPGDVNVKSHEDLHKLVVIEGPVWTLVVTGPKRKSWGFVTEKGWVRHSDYGAWLDRHATRKAG